MVDATALAGPTNALSLEVPPRPSTATRVVVVTVFGAWLRGWARPFGDGNRSPLLGMVGVFLLAAAGAALLARTGRTERA